MAGQSVVNMAVGFSKLVDTAIGEHVSISYSNESYHEKGKVSYTGIFLGIRTNTHTEYNNGKYKTLAVLFIEGQCKSVGISKIFNIEPITV